MARNSHALTWIPERAGILPFFATAQANHRKSAPGALHWRSHRGAFSLEPSTFQDMATAQGSWATSRSSEGEPKRLALSAMPGGCMGGGALCLSDLA